jgi:Uma2 family endonuclease
MNIAAPETDRRYSREEFRRWCEAQPRGRFERVDGRIVATAPASAMRTCGSRERSTRRWIVR